MTVYLDLENLTRLIDRYLCGTDSVRDWGLLDAVAHRPQATVFGQEAYPGLHLKAAALMDSVLRNHPLLDGNKLLAILSAALFCRYNGLDLVPPTDEGERVIVAAAAGEHTIESLAGVLAGWTVPL